METLEIEFMALTDQPYLPLYVRDWLSNLKLKTCKAETHGIMINIMCLMHLSDDYGKIWLNAKYKQTDKQNINFAIQLSKFLPFDKEEIERGLTELLFEKIITIEDDFLVCKRMVNDGQLSIKRCNIGREGGLKTQRKQSEIKAKLQANDEASILPYYEANDKANTENANAIENEIIIDKKEVFEKFRKVFPGSKRGLDTEYENFQKKYKNWIEILPLLLPAIEKQIEIHDAKINAKQFAPEYPMLSTWINQKRWEEEVTIEVKQTINAFKPKQEPVNPAFLPLP
jgi:hypothetical protein